MWVAVVGEQHECCQVYLYMYMYMYTYAVTVKLYIVHIHVRCVVQCILPLHVRIYVCVHQRIFCWLKFCVVGSTANYSPSESFLLYGMSNYKNWLGISLLCLEQLYMYMCMYLSLHHHS